ncbi:MAG TPA: hypothetical protein VI755_01965 [Anaerolineales bacterium]|nr:hypothetical protein [Anaerolineales bacterium]
MIPPQPIRVGASHDSPPSSIFLARLGANRDYSTNDYATKSIFPAAAASLRTLPQR